MQSEIVVVARSIILRDHLCRRQSIHRAGPPSSHNCQNPFAHSVDGHRFLDRDRTPVLVHVNPTMSTGVVFLGEDGKWKLHRHRLPRRHCLSLQCGGHCLRSYIGFFAHCAGLEAPDDSQDEDGFGWYS